MILRSDTIPINKEHELKNSLIKKIQKIQVSLVAVIFLSIGVAILFIHPITKQIQHMHAANRSLGYLVNCFDALYATKAELNKGKFDSISKREIVKNQDYFQMSFRLAIESLEHYPDTKQSLQKNAIRFDDLMQRMNKTIQNNLLHRDKDLFNKELTYLDDEIRGSFIKIKYESDRMFYQLYSSRHKPIWVIGLMGLIIIIVIRFYTKEILDRLKASVRNLLKSIDLVSKGDLTHRAKIISDDELGVITSSFNSMVQNFAQAREERKLSLSYLSSLQKVTATFSKATTSEQVYDIIIQTVFKELKVIAGYIALYDDQDEIYYPRMINITEKQALPTPSFYRAIRERRALMNKTSNGDQFYIPLLIAGNPIGLIAMTFEKNTILTEEVQQFIVAAIRQSAQALKRTQLFDDAQAAIRTRDDFLSIASHELKTPLTPLKLGIQSLRRRIDTTHLEFIPKEDILKVIQSSDKQISRLNRLIEDLLDISRISAGKFTLSMEKVNLATLIEDVVKSYKIHLDRSNMEINLDLEQVVFAHVDPIRVEQVLINFITNAAKYAPDHPMTIKLEKIKDKAMISVMDHGPGIRAEDQERIFNRFERIKDNQFVGGLGLGLYISKQIVLAHHGEITVQSELGIGSTFTAIFPLNQ